MQKEFVTYEIAKKLKELGFDEPCIATYMKHAAHGNPFQYNLDYHTKVQLDHGLCPKNSEYINDWVSAPLWQQVVDWLRINHNISVWYREIDADWKKLLVVNAERNGNTEFDINLYQYEYDVMENGEYVYTHMYPTFEETREQAILKALELCKKNS